MGFPTTHNQGQNGIQNLNVSFFTENSTKNN